MYIPKLSYYSPKIKAIINAITNITKLAIKIVPNKSMTKAPAPAHDVNDNPNRTIIISFELSFFI